MPDRIFTEEEVREIVRRASRQQAEDAERREAREHGLTLDDLERLGAEVGLEPVYLRAAAEAVQTGRGPVAETETQTPTHVIVERRIDHPFTPEAWEDTVGLLRNRFGIDMGMWYGNNAGGRVEQVGRAHEWTHVSQWGTETRVSTSEREGRTRLILSQRVGHASPRAKGLSYAAVLGLVAGIIGGIPIAGALDSYGAFFVVFLAIMLVTVLVAAPIITRIDKRWRAKKQRTLNDLAAEIEQTFEAASPPLAETAPQTEAPVAAETTSVPQPVLHLDVLPEEGDSARAPERNRTRS